jgi:hypothetical protein
MLKTSLYIEPEVDAALSRKAQAQGISKAQLIRDALHTAAEDAPRPRLLGIGTLRGAPGDLATNLDEHLDGLGED